MDENQNIADAVAVDPVTVIDAIPDTSENPILQLEAEVLDSDTSAFHDFVVKLENDSYESYTSRAESLGLVPLSQTDWDGLSVYPLYP